MERKIQALDYKVILIKKNQFGFPKKSKLISEKIQIDFFT